VLDSAFSAGASDFAGACEAWERATRSHDPNQRGCEDINCGSPTARQVVDQDGKRFNYDAEADPRHEARVGLTPPGTQPGCVAG
jgi:hypothetical protein